MDWAAYEAAGLYDPASPEAADRRALLEYLHAEGCTLDEMVAAHARGRLFGLAGDRLIRPPGEELTLHQVADRLGAGSETVHRLWRALGLPVHAHDDPVARPADEQALATCLAIGALVGEESMLGVARVIGSALARIAEAESGAMRSGFPDLSLDSSGSELATAQTFAGMAAFVEQIGRTLDTVHRHHLETSRRHFEVSDSADVVLQRGARFAVGFADLSGFTALSQSLPLDELGRLLAMFEAAAGDLIHEGGGRVVKFIGDCVMYVAPQPLPAADIAYALMDRITAAGVLPLRVGLSYGTLLAQDGDYYGSSVNLASRLVAVAEPGEILVSDTLAERLEHTHYHCRPTPPQRVRGFAELVTPHRLVRSGA